jgi:hypothetical protein
MMAVRTRFLVNQLGNFWWLWLALLALPALWPFYSEGLPRSFDGGLHLLRLSLLDEYIRQGILLPRWTPALILGYGYPLYNFYAPGAYYLAEVLHLLGLDLYDAFIGAFVIQILAAAYGMYFFARDLFTPDLQPSERTHGAADAPAALSTGAHTTNWPALVAAVAYLYGPYLLTNVYIRGAIAEAGAQALLPWIFWSMRRLVRAKEPARYFLPALFLLSALALTHNITLLFLPPVLLLFLLLHWLQVPDRRQRLLWIGGALLCAMGSSAFFWLPLLLERHDLAETAYLIARSAWLPGSVWNWQNFLDTGFHYTHTFARPIKLGLVQLGLAALGLVTALLLPPWRKTGAREWLFWLVVTVATGAFMGAWALPFWLSNDILPIAQFTWRLLAILSLPLALFVGGLVLPWRARWIQLLISTITLLVIILAHRPALAWMDLYAAESATVSQAVFAQIEIDKGVITGGRRNSSIQEFRPRWADTDLVLAADVTPAPTRPAITVTAANDFDLQLAVDAPAATFLRFATFYFPGWEVHIDGIAQPTYPSTNLGLLTVDLPAGDHVLTVQWVGTTTQRIAGYLSLLTLVILIAICWQQRPLRFYALLPALLLLIGALALQWRPPLQAVAQPLTAVERPGLTLRALRLQEREAGYLHLYPYWQVHARQPATLAMSWQLYDAQGTLVSAAVSHPYFNTIRADSWAPGALIDDVQRLPLPATLRPGTYQLMLQLLEDGKPATAAIPVATYELRATPPPAATPEHALDLRYGAAIRLVGYTMRAAGQSVVADGALPPVVKAGDYLRYTLFWQADGLVDQNYHAFVHLTDHLGQPLVQEDQLPGPLFHAPQLWNNYRPYNDSYLLRIPADAPSGLYWPGVGVYDFATLDRLPLPESNADRHLLPPIKILNTPVGKAEVTSGARFGDVATLLGYTGSGISAPHSTAPRQRGDQLTLTFYWQSNSATATDYTRFVQVYDPALGMAAQFDSPPQQGGNPTSAWVPGEIIADPVTLTVQPDALPGTYGIYVGFYDPADGNRLPVLRTDGEQEAAAWVQVGQIVVE